MARPWRHHRRLLSALGLLFLAVAPAACGGAPRFWAPDPVTRQGQQILSLWQGAVTAALCVGALVWALVGYSVIKFRRRGEDLPSQSAYNVPIEVVYTAAPLLVVAVLFAYTVGTQRDVDFTTARPDLVVDVVGFQWQWQFRYPEHSITVTGTPGQPPTMVLPVGSTVRLRLDSPDVVHSFWVPRFLSKRDLIPGVENQIDLRIEEAGTWVGRCAEFCGLDHHKMNFSVRAVPAEEFRRWLSEHSVAAA